MPRCIHLELGGRQEECGILQAKSRKHSRGERIELGQILLMATKVEDWSQATTRAMKKPLVNLMTTALAGP